MKNYSFIINKLFRQSQIGRKSINNIMSSNNGNEVQVNGSKLIKKVSKKSSTQSTKIPIDALGFRSKVFYDPGVYDFIPKRKPNKYAKYQSEKKQHNLRSKLTCVIDLSHTTYQEVGDLRFTKRHQWKQIKFVKFRVKELITCSICMETNFVAPQITFCGHVFCWHCILMHYQKSLKATSCPVCNQIFQLSELKTCDTFYLPPLLQGDKIKLRLKTRIINQRIIYNPQNSQQQTNLSHVVRMQNERSLQKYEIQHQQIINEMKTNQDAQTQKCLQKVLEMSHNRIEEHKLLVKQERNKHLKLHKHQILLDGSVVRVLSQQQQKSEKFVTFYQQQSGRLVFLHPICQKYLLLNYNKSLNLPFCLQQVIVLKQQTQLSSTNLKRYKYLDHLSQNQDFDFVFIKMNHLIEFKLLHQYQKEFYNYKTKKEEILHRENIAAKIQNSKYQKEQDYIRRLKKMEESQFHDIVVPVNMVDFTQIQDNNIFPSLVSTSSVVSQQNAKTQPILNIQPKLIQKQKGNRFILNKQQFPQLQLAIKKSLDQTNLNEQSSSQLIRASSQQVTPSTKVVKSVDFPQMNSKEQQFLKPKKSQINEERSKIKGKKKKKERFVDVTHQFFHYDQHQQY